MAIWKLEQFIGLEVPAERFARSRKDSRNRVLGVWTRWTEDEENELREHLGEPGYYKRFAERTGRTYSAVNRKACQLRKGRR